MRAYKDYYRRFNKTYHVQLQLESILYKNKSIPSVSALVEAMFMAEMKNMLLTAGHDLDAVQLPLILDVSTGEESYVLMRGDEQTVKPGDMLIADRVGVISNIIYGPDQRTQIRASTRSAIFTVYAPAGDRKSFSGRAFAGYRKIYPYVCTSIQCRVNARFWSIVLRSRTG